MQLIVLPTEKCNFRCLYCYEDFKNGVMPSEIANSLINLLEREGARVSTLEIDWFGGEPLLAFGTVKKVMNYVKFEMPKSEEFRLISSMTTNGLLLSREKLFELTDLGVNDFQISFDGDRDEHDKLRVLANGSPTFDRVWENVIAAHDSYMSFSIALRIHSNQSNTDSIRRFLSRIAISLGNDYRFSVYIRPLSKLGSPLDSTLPIFEKAEFMGVVEGLRCYAQELGLKVFVRPANYVCYAANPDSFVLRSDGSVCKCTVALCDERNLVGCLLPNGCIVVDDDKVRWWTRGLSSRNELELRCPLKGECAQ